MKKLILTLVILILTNIIIYAQNIEKYSQVRIFATTHQSFQAMESVGLFLDHGIYKKGLYYETWLSESEIELLKKSGVPFVIIVDDWDKYYKSIPQMSPMEIQRSLQQSKDDYNVSHSIYGSMGGYLTWAEVVAKLDSMRLQYPTLISQKFSLGNTYENRPIWCVRMTKNPDAPTGRPEVFLQGLIHAREPAGMESIIYYMYWLLENYNIDPIATYILNNREIYVVPVLNADGYVYNQTTNPNGGGMWRKNRKPCSGGTGADLNRNWGIYQYWNSTNNGSSTSCSSDTYRGTNPFSEPEDLVMANFINSRNIKTGLSYHTYSNLLIRPWAWCDPTPTPDDAIFQEWSVDMTRYNHYAIGQPYSTVGYYVRGDELDWLYNDSGHTKILAMTPEVGNSSDNFWPPQSRILPLAQENLLMCQYISLVAGPYVGVNNTRFNKSSYTQNEVGTFKVIFRNKGRMDGQNVRIEWVPLSNYVTIPTQYVTLASMPSLYTDSVTFTFQVSGSCPNNYAVPTRLRIKQNDTVIVYQQNVNVLVGNGVAVLLDSAENGFGNWTTNQGWAIVTSQFHSPTHSFTDSPSGNYQNNANNSMTLNFPINASTTPALFLSFWHKYATEANFDFCYVEVSSDNGTNWQQVASYTGTLSNWTYQEFDITQYANASSNVRVRFRLYSDVSLTADGWYVDDIKILGYQSPVTGVILENNQLPTTYSLEQNYPNPFNPMTTIKFALPKDGFVRLVVYDILGREVSSIVNEFKNAGNYSVNFDASRLASGIYFYKIEVNGFTDIKKMTVIK